MKKSNEEVEALIRKAAEMDGTYTSMTYEKGIMDALEWVISDDEEDLL